MEPITLSRWESKSALLDHVNRTDEPPLVVGLHSEAPRRFYSFSLSPPGSAPTGSSRDVSIFSSDLGTEPAAVLVNRGQQVIVGHDTWLTWLDAHTFAIVESRRLGGVFYEFLPTGHDDEVVVLHELGVLRINASGVERWSVHTDVITSHHVDTAGNLVLAVTDRPSPVIVALDSGRTLT